MLNEKKTTPRHLHKFKQRTDLDVLHVVAAAEELRLGPEVVDADEH